MDTNDIKKFGTAFDYAGFWIRLGASIIDSILILFITAPILFLLYGESYLQSEAAIPVVADFLISYILPLVATVLFWTYKSATPGKMVTKLSVVDAETGHKPTVKQSIIRYVGYFISAMPLCLGFLWVARDTKKQGWHDKMAGTVVIRANSHDRDSRS